MVRKSLIATMAAATTVLGAGMANAEIKEVPATFQVDGDVRMVQVEKTPQLSTVGSYMDFLGTEFGVKLERDANGSPKVNIDFGKMADKEVCLITPKDGQVNEKTKMPYVLGENVTDAQREANTVVCKDTPAEWKGNYLPTGANIQFVLASDGLGDLADYKDDQVLTTKFDTDHATNVSAGYVTFLNKHFMPEGKKLTFVGPANLKGDRITANADGSFTYACGTEDPVTIDWEKDQPQFKMGFAYMHDGNAKSWGEYGGSKGTMVRIPETGDKLRLTLEAHLKPSQMADLGCKVNGINSEYGNVGHGFNPGQKLEYGEHSVQLSKTQAEGLGKLATEVRDPMGETSVDFASGYDIMQAVDKTPGYSFQMSRSFHGRLEMDKAGTSIPNPFSAIGKLFD